ncbi:MAG: hypothetical protein ABSG05_03550 [Candidatus Pacearchaeota archaeon]|jgi:hypothetical protein
MRVEKVLSWIGIYKEQGKWNIDFRQVYSIIGILFLIGLGSDAYLSQPIFWDNWGITSPYITKFMIIFMFFIVGYYIWGYLRLLNRVNKLEKK